MAAVESNSLHALPASTVAPLLAQSLGRLLREAPMPVGWVIPGLTPSAAPGFMVSVPNAGKSFLCLQMLVAIATGRSFLGYPPGGAKGAIYLSLEDPPEVVHRRLWSIVEAMKLAGEWTAEDERLLYENSILLTPDWEAVAGTQDQSGTVYAPTTYLPLLMPGILEAVRVLNGRGVSPGMITIDTFAAAAEGDENSARDTKPLLAATHQIAGTTGYATLTCHHAAKGQSGARTQTRMGIDDLMSPDWIRGSSALLGSARFVIQLAPLRVDQAERAGLEPEKARRGGYLVFGATKQSVAPRGEWRALEQVDFGDPGAGSWAPLHNSLDVMASLKGARAQDELSTTDAFLRVVHGGGASCDRQALAVRFCPNAKKPLDALRSLIKKVRNAGLLQRDSLLLTVKGLERVQGMKTDTDQENLDE